MFTRTAIRNISIFVLRNITNVQIIDRPTLLGPNTHRNKTIVIMSYDREWRKVRAMGEVGGPSDGHFGYGDLS